jgi:hypothetical protein
MEELKQLVRMEFIAGKIKPVGFQLPCPNGHSDTKYEESNIWFCARCKKEFRREDSSIWKNKINVSELHKFLTSIRIESHPQVLVVLEYLIISTDVVEINKVINVRIKYGVQYGFNESVELARKALEERNLPTDFENGYSRGEDIVMVLKR